MNGRTRRLIGLRRGAGSAPDGVMVRLAQPDDAAVAALFEGDGVARLLIGRTGVLHRTSAAVAPLIGRTPPTGSPVVDLFDPGAQVAAWQAIEAAMARGRPAMADLAAAVGSRPIHVEVAPVAEPDGRVVGAVLALREVGEPSGEAAAQAGRLQAVGLLAGGIAHDFNNLLQVIGGAAEALAEGGGAAEDIAAIAAAAARGSALVRQLLAFARQQPLQPRLVAVNDAVTQVAILLRRILGEAIRLELALEEPGRAVTIDPGQLDQVLVNLAVNARDAMPKGGRLALRTGHRTVLAAEPIGAETLPPGRYVTIEVADTGRGIDPAVLPRIFEPFFTTRPGGGGGLGLSTVLGIVRQSGGFLAVQSAPGRGTTMRILLPRATGAPAPAEAPSAAAAVGAGVGMVFLVEDEEPVRRLAERALVRHGWTVQAFETGEAALAALDTAAPPAAVVTDMVMPGMDGAAVVRAVRARTGCARLPAVVVSGYAEATLRAEIGAVATAFLPKPYRMRDLVARLGALLGREASPPV